MQFVREERRVRLWRFEESPCPGEPTPIQPVSTESRRAEPPNLEPSPFPAPIVAFQNVPAAPDPRGFAGLLELLSRPDLFRDITGLTENQRNALAGLQAALGTAQFFGGRAADLALQANMNRDIDKALDKINEQHKSGAINNQQRAQLTEAALRSMIGGGTQAPTQPLTTEEVERVTRTAGAQDASVSLSRGNLVARACQWTHTQVCIAATASSAALRFFWPEQRRGQ